MRPVQCQTVIAMITGRAVLSWPIHGWAREPSPKNSSSALNWPSGGEDLPENRRRDGRREHDGDEDDHLVDHGQLHLGVQQHGEERSPARSARTKVTTKKTTVWPMVFQKIGSWAIRT